jgi:hypothetical protein
MAKTGERYQRAFRRLQEAEASREPDPPRWTPPTDKDVANAIALAVGDNTAQRIQTAAEASVWNEISARVEPGTLFDVENALGTFPEPRRSIAYGMQQVAVALEAPTIEATNEAVAAMLRLNEKEQMAPMTDREVTAWLNKEMRNRPAAVSGEKMRELLSRIASRSVDVDASKISHNVVAASGEARELFESTYVVVVRERRSDRAIGEAQEKHIMTKDQADVLVEAQRRRSDNQGSSPWSTPAVDAEERTARQAAVRRPEGRRRLLQEHLVLSAAGRVARGERGMPRDPQPARQCPIVGRHGQGARPGLAAGSRARRSDARARRQ